MSWCFTSYKYLQTVLEQINLGLLSVNDLLILDKIGVCGRVPTVDREQTLPDCYYFL